MQGKNIKAILLTIMLLTFVGNQFSVYLNQAVEAKLPTPREETFVIASWLSVTNLQNPLVMPYCSYLALCQVMAEFFWYLDYASGEMIYWLATGYEYSDDYMAFTIHLRDGVLWNDGEPFTSEDVKYTFELVGSNSLLNNNDWVSEWVASIETPDDLTVVLHLTKANPRVHLKLRAQNWGEFIVVPKHIWENVENPQLADVFGRGDVPVECVFTGPYMLDEILEDSGILVLVRNDNYWAKDVLGVFPEPKYVIYRNTQSPDIEYYEVVSGDTYDGEWFELLPTDLLLAALEVPNNNLTLCPYLDPAIMSLMPNCEEYPLSMPEVRWALSYAFDRDSFSAAYPLYPPVEPVYHPWPDWGSTEKYNYDDIFSAYPIEYNLTKAAEILDGLNFIDRNEDGIRETPNGTLLSWDVICEEVNVPIFAGKIVDDYASIGINLNVMTMNYDILMEWESVGDFDILYIMSEPSVFSFTGDIVEFFEYYRSIYYAPIGEPLSQIFSATAQRYTNAELDDLYDQMAAISPDDPQMDDLAHQAIEIFMRDMPTIPIVQSPRLEVFNTEYWTGQPTEDNYYVFTAPWDPLYKFIINNVIATGVTPAISYTYVWITDTVAAFNGADSRSYGPFEEGDYARMPQGNADELVSQGLASYESPIPGLSQILTAISTVNEAISSNSEDIAVLQTTIAAQNSQITTLLTVVVVNIVLTLVLLVLILVRKK